MKGFPSARVTRPERAGRAPYNFVPLADKTLKPIFRDGPPAHDRFHVGLHSGRIDVEIEALEDFYIRGMWDFGMFAGSKEDRPHQSHPFEVDGALRIPGSSLRGMIRTLVEILSASPLDRLNDTQLFFRTVAAVADPRNARSFEPQAAAYKKRIVPDGKLAVRAGYLYNSRDRWIIKDAATDAQGRQIFRCRTSQQWLRREATFDVEPATRQPVRFDIGRHAFANVHDHGREKGWLICSGWIYGKTKQWVIREEDTNARNIPIPDEDVKAYKEGGITQDIKNKAFGYDDQTRGLPCFYISWQDRDGEQHVSFGHTPYFRLPYVSRPTNRIPATASRHGREGEWDMASAIFGHVPRDKMEGKQREARRGRLTFEDGVLMEAPDPAVGPEVQLVLGQPKPTTFQHYLVQVTDALEGSLHWDGNYQLQREPHLRGHKLYWHRPGEARKDHSPGKDKVATRFCPARKGAKFHACICYENLDKRELGALLTAIELPEGCHHRLGMAKPYGFGSFALRILRHKAIDRIERYRSFTSPSGTLAAGESDFDGNVSRQAFARWYLQSENATWDQLWTKGSRLHELKCLLTWKPPHEPDDWANMTRYLEFGAMPENYNGGRNYNEYLEWGFPDLSRPQLQKRRPLPPASQVLEGGPAIPKDRRPPFVEPRRRERSDFLPRRGTDWRKK